MIIQKVPVKKMLNNPGFFDLLFETYSASNKGFRLNGTLQVDSQQIEFHSVYYRDSIKELIK
jgi:hypothetical protein